jgi:hypothetical protein
MESTNETKQTKPKVAKKAPKKSLQEEAPVEQPVVQEMKVEVAPVEVATESETQQNDESATDDQMMSVIEQLLTSASTQIMDATTKLKSCSLSGANRTVLDELRRKFKKAYFNLDSEVDKLYTTALKSQEKELSKKNKTKSSSGNKSNGAIMTPIEAEPFLLEFMGLPTGTLVSRNDARAKVYNFINEHRNNKNQDIFVYKDGPNGKEMDNNQYKIIGSLATLFKGIDKVMDSRLKTINTEIKKLEDAKKEVPNDLKKAQEKITTHIANRRDSIKFTEVFTYNTYAFAKEKLW